MAGNRCASPLTTPSPTTSTWCTKPLSSTNARSTVLCPPSRPTTSSTVSVARRGKAPSGFKTVTPATRSDSIYKLNYGLFALGNVLFDLSTKHDFLRLPGVFAERKEPEWTQIASGIMIVDFTMDLDLNLWVLIEHSPPPVSRPPFMHGVRGGTIQMPIFDYELTLAVWGGAMALMSGCRFYTPSALTG